MRIQEACAAIAKLRGNSIIVATMGAMSAFDALGIVEGRINSVPLMGGASCLGLGLALGNPGRGVIVVDGDASLLMQLGSLATVAGLKPGNYAHFVVHNGTQFTGGVNLKTAVEKDVDFCAIASGAGYSRAQRIFSVEEIEALGDDVFCLQGPSFYQLCVQVEPPRIGPDNPQQEMPDRQFSRMGEEALALATWLGN